MMAAQNPQTFGWEEREEKGNPNSFVHVSSIFAAYLKISGSLPSRLVGRLSILEPVSYLKA
jgi:hypothetical protein